MSEGEKLHRLLEFIAKTDQQSYDYDELIPAYKYGFFKKPNVKEIERLCTLLIQDELLLGTPGNKSGGITVKPQAIAAYYANKYFQKEEEAGYSSSTILRGVIIGGLVLGGLMWLGYIVYERGENLQNAEEKIQNAELKIQQAEAQNQKRQRQIESLSSSKDSLLNQVKSMRTEIENLKKPVQKKPTKVKRSKK